MPSWPEVEVEALPAQNAQADRFAVLGGHDRDAQVVFLIAGLHGDAAVVGQPLFGNVQARHDLEPRDDRRMQVTHVGRHGHRFQNPVHAIPEADGVGVGLEVDVRGVEAQGFLENLVHESRDGGFDRRIGLLALHVEDDLLADFRLRSRSSRSFWIVSAPRPKLLLDDRRESSWEWPGRCLKRLLNSRRRLPCSIWLGGSLNASVRQSSSMPSGSRW